MTPALWLTVPLVLVLSACGGSSTGSSSGSGSSTKAAYVQQAAQVCRDAGAAKLKAGSSTPSSTAAIAPYVDALVAVAKDAAGKLRALTPPPADQAALASKLLDPLDVQVTEGEAFAAKVRAAGSDDAKVLGLLGNKPGAGKIDVPFLKAYGLDDCVQAAQG